MVRRWSRSVSNFYALIGQNVTGEFMRKIYAASWKLFTLTSKADRVLCQLVMFLTVFFTGCTKWNTAAIKSLLLFIAGLFIGFFFEKCIAYESRKSDFGWHRFRFSPCLIRLLKRVQNSQAILALLDSFRGLHLEWWAWVIYKFHEVKRSLCGWFMHVFKIWDTANLALVKVRTGWPYKWFWIFFKRSGERPTIDHPEYWMSAICLEKLWNTAS